MTKEEMKRVLVIQKLVDQAITTAEAATTLELSTRQVLRLKAKYDQEGAQGLAHKNRGRQPMHTIPQDQKERIAILYSEKYFGSNNCHFSELLAEHEQVVVSPSSVRRILIEKGLKPSRQKRRAKTHRPRDRKPQAGLLWQMDASPHDWLEGRGPRLTLHGAVDDATGTVLAAVFAETENLNAYYHLLDVALRRYGLPVAIYTDRHTMFKSPTDKLTIQQELDGVTPGLTHFGLAMHDLRITHIKALSPQAKGRIERLWGTFQDRLIIELRLLHVTSLAEANAVLPALIAKHNRRFAVNPADAQSAYRAVDQRIQLQHILCTRETRVLGPGETLSFRGTIYTIQSPSQRQTIAPKTRVEVRQNFQGRLFLWYQDHAFTLQPVLHAGPPKPAAIIQKTPVSSIRKPNPNHPWRKWAGPAELKHVTQTP